jgi:hypothetical protein
MSTGNTLLRFLNLPRRLDIPFIVQGIPAYVFSYYLEIHHEGHYAEIGYYRPVSHMEDGVPEILFRVGHLVQDWDLDNAIVKLRNFLKEKNYLRYGSNSD